jgi:nucleoside 2-deoxyribosyltransferase
MTSALIYLAGPINGRTDSDCKDWREYAKSRWGGPTLDPMSRDYRGREQEPGIAREIVEGDKEDIDRAKGLLVYYDQPSVGTSMEVLYAWQMGKPVVVVNTSGRPASPWLQYHASLIVHCEDARSIRQAITDALAELNNLLPPAGVIPCTNHTI